MNKRIQERIHQLTNSNKIIVDHSGYSVTLPLPVIKTNEGIVNMQPTLFINGTRVIERLENCGKESSTKSEIIGNGNVIRPRELKTFWKRHENDILPMEFSILGWLAGVLPGHFPDKKIENLSPP